MVGPDFIQIGTEGGFLPRPVVVPNQPIVWNGDPLTFNFGNVSDHGLLIAPAERVDVIVDFSAYAGKTLILYNDAPAAFPALDPRNDYYTGNPDQFDTGGTASTLPGFGPNTRTIMQIRVAKRHAGAIRRRRPDDRVDAGPDAAAVHTGGRLRARRRTRSSSGKGPTLGSRVRRGLHREPDVPGRGAVLGHRLHLRQQRELRDGGRHPDDASWPSRRPSTTRWAPPSTTTAA